MTYTLLDFHPKLKSDVTHIGLIPDGTGRWASQKNITPYDAYLFAGKQIVSFLRLCLSNKFRIISLYFSSIQNFNRSPERIDAFCKAQEYWCENYLLPICDEFGAKIVAVGNRKVLPYELLNALDKLENGTKEFDSHQINICVAYNPLEEIIDAVNRTDRIEDFVSHLWVQNPLDLVIRTGGANVLSNFLPLQSGYARFYTLDALFPDVQSEEYLQIINGFFSLERHFGE
jgi:undecaprenyl diphosphate synthase